MLYVLFISFFATQPDYDMYNVCLFCEIVVSNKHSILFLQPISGLEISTTKMGTVRNGMLLLYNTRRGWMVCNAMGDIKKS